MFVINKLLQTTLKTYFGKYVLHESKLDNLTLEANGNIELVDIELNCKEINQRITSGGLKVEQFVVKKLNVSVNWERIIDKLELTDVVINLGISDKKQNNNISEKDSLSEKDPQTSLFFYNTEKSLTTDSLLDYGESNDSNQGLSNEDVEGYKTMSDSVDNIKKNVEIVVNSTQIHMDSMWFSINSMKFKTENDNINNLVFDTVNVYNGRMHIISIPTMQCKIGNDKCDISIPEDIKIEEQCSLQYLAQIISVIFKYVKHINRILNSYKTNQPEEKKNVNMCCHIKRIYQENPISFEIDNININNQGDKFEISISSLDTPFITGKKLNIDLKTNSPDQDDESLLGLFSKQIAFYEDGSKKPEGSVSVDQRSAYYKQNRRLAKKHINITAESIEAIDIKGFVSLCKKIYGTINDEKNIFLKENEGYEEEESIEEDTLPKFFLEIQSNIVNIRLFGNKNSDREIFLNSFNTHITIGKGLWSVQTKHIDVISKSNNLDTKENNIILMTTIDKVHLAGTLSLNQIVADIKYIQIKKIQELVNVIVPLLDSDSDPMKLKMNFKINNIQGSDQMMNQKLYYQGGICEIFSHSSDNITCTLSSLLIDIDNYRLVDAKLIHAKIKDKTIRCSSNKIDAWLCAKELPEMIDNLNYFVNMLSSSNEKDYSGESEDELLSYNSDDSDDDDSDVINNQKNEKEKQRINIIENYNPDVHEETVNDIPMWNTLKNEFMCNHLKVHILEDSESLGTIPLSEINHISIDLKYIRLFVFKEDNCTQDGDSETKKGLRVELMIQSLEVKDGIQTSLWDKAVRTGDIKIIYIDRYLSLDFGKELFLHVDQRFLEFVQKVMTTYNKSYQLRFNPDMNDSTLLGNFGIGTNVSNDSMANANNRPPFKSIHISKMVFNFDYKSQDGKGIISFVNCDQLRGSKIVFNEFYLFQIKSWSTLMNQFVVNLFSNIQNLQGIVSGIKPLKPVANILASSKNLLILPINNHIGKKRSESFTKQIKNIVKDVTVEVLELGSAMHFNINKKESIYSNQPVNWKEGLNNGKKEFEDNCQTIIAFVQNSDDADLVNLPIVMIRPLTGFMSQFLQGLANQIKPSRKELMDNKYK
jgi:hypothetical protein